MATQLPGARALGAAGGHRVVQAPDRCGLWLWHPPPLPVKGGWVLVTKAEPMWVAGCSGHRQGGGHGTRLGGECQQRASATLLSSRYARGDLMDG